MKIKIGKYKTWFGPYQLAEFLCFWTKKDKDEFGFPHTKDWIHDFGEWLAYGSVEKDKGTFRLLDNRNITLLNKLLVFISTKKNRKVKIQIDPWDTWNMDSTLSMIILPMLKQLQATKHGSPKVDDEDVPTDLRSDIAPDPDDEYSDLNVHKRWDWVLFEMIWTFEQLNDEDNDAQFHSGNSDIYFEKLKDGSGNSIMKQGKNDTHVYDKEAHAKHLKRISKGLILFGKYYQGLWD